MEERVTRVVVGIDEAFEGAGDAVVVVDDGVANSSTLSV